LLFLIANPANRLFSYFSFIFPRFFRYSLYHFNRETGVYLRQDIQGVSLTRYSIDEALRTPSPTFGRGNTELLYSDPELIIKEDEGDDE